jgi:hypothetical protein
MTTRDAGDDPRRIRDGVRTPTLPLIPIAAAIAVLAAGCGGSARATAAVTRIELAPAPEGPTLVASTATTAGHKLLAALAGKVPRRWPPNPTQDCHLGTTITVTTTGGMHRYGPCNWPLSIDRLRQALVAAAHAHAVSSPTRRVTASAWKAVLNDWYDGRMDHWHSCAAVMEAIRHLPADPPVYSTVELDLKAYARGVCVTYPSAAP